MPAQHTLPVRRKGIIARPITVNEVAEYFGVSRRTIYYWMEDRRIPYLRIGRCLRFKLEDIEQANTVKGGAKWTQ
jgi:excisionase family DNA binding protein